MSAHAHHVVARVERAGFTLDIDVGWNERVAVIFGPSGAGKSTLFDVLLGVTPVRTGNGGGPTVRLGGRSLDDPAAGRRTPLAQRGLGWVPQDAALFPHLSVAGNLRFGLARAAGSNALERAIEVLELGSLLGRRVDQLSGGERQRVAIARALASGPRALLLDEPLASLDLPLRARVLPYLLRIRDALELPMLYITHDPDEAIVVGEIAIVLDAGRMVAAGAPREVLWSRAVLPLSEALGLENVLEGRVLEVEAGTAVVSTRGGLRIAVAGPLSIGEEVRLGLRAQDVVIAADPPGRISARNVIEARVVRCETTEGGPLVRLDAGDAIVAKVTEAAVKQLGLEPGARVHLIVKAQALRRLA